MLKYIQVVKYNLTGESVCVFAKKDGAGQKKKGGGAVKSGMVAKISTLISIKNNLRMHKNTFFI